ncbi:MAG: sulfocyanin-like copper-binding protein [Gammaproteobacteria bacterium]
MAQWTFTPVQTGRYKMGCGVPAHAQAGMVSHILVN